MAREPEKPMRKSLFLFLSSALIAQAQPTPAQQAEQYYSRGMAAEKAGNLPAAKAAYNEALRLNPNHANARFRAAELKIDGSAVAEKGREAKFAATVIPQINLEEASLQESLDALQMTIEKAAGADNTPNFIIQDPENRLKGAKVTLQLKGVPAKAVLDYILSQASAKVKYDKHAVVISPNRSGS